MLASVKSVDEALLALQLGADIIDLKDPAAGALGALDPRTIREIVCGIDRRQPVSATVGDLPMEPEALCEAVRTVAATGVDFVKVGFFGSANHAACVEALAAQAHTARLVAVVFADQRPDFRLLDDLAMAGFAGAMLDTADKRAGGLRACLPGGELAAFVERAHGLKLLVGLAGSLTALDIAPLLEFHPDYLGFRGALCFNAQREASIDPDAFSAVRARIALHAQSDHAVNPLHA